MKFSTIIVTGCLFIGASYAQAQKVTEPSATSTPDWSRPYEPYRIVGDVYYVGTYDLAFVNSECIQNIKLAMLIIPKPLETKKDMIEL